MQSFIARGSADKYTNRAVDRLLVPVGKEAFSPTQSQTPIALPGRLMLRTSFALFCSRSYPMVLLSTGKSAASAPPPLLPSRAVKLEKSAGDPRPLSAISPHKIRRPHTARGAPPGADFAQMTCNLPAPGATDVGDVYGDAGHRACWRTRGVRRGPKGTDVSFLESAAATAPFLARRASTGSSAGIATGAAEPMVNSRKLSRTFHSPMMPWTPAPGMCVMKTSSL